MHSLIAPTINVLILVAVLAYYLRQPIRQFVRTRHSSLQDQVRRVSEQLADARQRFDEFTSKLRSMDSEIQALREQATQEAEATKLRVITEAKRLGQNILADARSTADNAGRELKLQLQRDFANQVVNRAEGILTTRLTGDDKVRIRQEFSRQVESIQ